MPKQFTPNPTEAYKLSKTRSLLTMAAITGSYLLLSCLLVGFKMQQIVLMALVNVLYFASAATRDFIKAFSVFVVYWIIFDYMKAFPNYRFNEVHSESIYLLEKRIFGIRTLGSVLTANEYLRIHASTFLNVLTGIFYLCWIPVPLGFAIYLYVRNRIQFFYFSYTFLLVNLIGFVVYYLYPAAPPWYIQYFGFAIDYHTPGNVAGLVRFDDFFHTGVFKGVYAQSSNVFAAMPSLHASYPVIVLYYGIRNKLGLINVLFAMIMLGIWFAAVYNSHHYVLDIVCGVLCAISGIFMFNYLAARLPVLSRFLQKSM